MINIYYKVFLAFILSISPASFLQINSVQAATLIISNFSLISPWQFQLDDFSDVTEMLSKIDNKNQKINTSRARSSTKINKKLEDDISSVKGNKYINDLTETDQINSTSGIDSSPQNNRYLSDKKLGKKLEDNMTMWEATKHIKGEGENLPNGNFLSGRAEKINRDLKDRYQGILSNEELGDTTGLLATSKYLTEEEQEVLISSINSSPEELNSQKNTFPLIPAPVPIILGILSLLGTGFSLKILLSKKTSSAEVNFWQNIMSKFNKSVVPDNVIFLHNRSLDKIKEIANKFQRIDNQRFGDREFIFYFKIKNNLLQEGNEYKSLSRSAELLKVAIDAKNLFLSLEQTEFRYRSSAQQELYNFVAELLKKNLSKSDFKDKTKKKLMEVLPLLKTDEGRKAIESYIKDLHDLAEHDLGLSLLSLFKENNLSDYSILKNVSDIVNSMANKDITDLKALTTLVMFDYEIFEKLGKIIGVSKKKSNPDTYAILLQYIGLTYKYQTSYAEFNELIELIKEWQKPYNSLVAIRQEYHPQEYQQPRDFTTSIPGINIYNKYEHLLA